jgi:hypothetical protein
MKKLPEIYKNNFTKKIKNNREVCYLRNEDTISNLSNISIEEEINNIFSGIGYSYNIPVEIVTNKKVYNTSLVAKTRENVVTLDNEIIAIGDIKSIKRLK